MYSARVSSLYSALLTHLGFGILRDRRFLERFRCKLPPQWCSFQRFSSICRVRQHMISHVVSKGFAPRHLLHTETCTCHNHSIFCEYESGIPASSCKWALPLSGWDKCVNPKLVCHPSSEGRQPSGLHFNVPHVEICRVRMCKHVRDVLLRGRALPNDARIHGQKR